MTKLAILKDISGCAIAGVMSQRGECFGAEAILRMIANMRDRANGLGGGFAAYGIYPEHADRYALHMMFDHAEGKRAAEELVSRSCELHHEEPIPTRPL